MPSPPLTLPSRSLPESCDVFSGNPASEVQRHLMHLAAIEYFARGVLDASIEQAARLANYGLTPAVIEYCSVALVWTGYLAAKARGEDPPEPAAKRPQELDRPEFWPSIVYDGEGPLGHFLGLWRWTHGDLKARPREQMPRELKAPPPQLDTTRRPLGFTPKTGGGMSIVDARKYDYEAAKRKLDGQVRRLSE